MRTLGEKFGLGRQIDFPEKQRHSWRLEVGLFLFAILCVIVAVVISKATNWGVESRPTGAMLSGAMLWLGF